MNTVSVLVRYVEVVRGLLRPSYHPERYYMRGPGPACVKRMGGGGLRTGG
ncbi:hypothetical protein VSX64_11180 [Aurantimonas sp. C2-6-R+9]|nr:MULTISPECIES: hypothetical protein [unclassified Aurantimonas]MEC5291113.1 hypothetical protein [Aurantimonas sp. C2-3-R2]MEC5381441.1 hypothetical protein [Aurantimonas sp. C2-6-R+9]MEC5412264.1 hypothetical protein [Aurantimonas sp. C2-4-R8]